MKQIQLLFIVVSCCCGIELNAQTAVGKWKSVDDITQIQKSAVEIYERGGKYFGKITKVYPESGESEDPICTKCPGDLLNKKVLGMEIITNMKYDKESKVYSDGKILDPETGNIYDCKIWVDTDGTLKVRGYVYFMYRTQTWLPLKD
jgi:uncharacterized protein (DUF2147 family)